MKYFSTFTGIGGFEIGIHNAWMRSQNKGRTIQGTQTGGTQRQPKQLYKHGDEGLSCIGYSEIDKYAIKVYERNFPNVRNYGDITKINAEELPDFDCLVGGFPCQAFSIAGKRKGFDDTRGTLFFDLARILRAKRPRLFVFENVKGLLSHDGGRTFKTIISTLDELGYDLQWQVLNSKNHGVPQNRERVFIAGHLRGTRRPEVFPLEGQSNQNTTVGESTETAIARTLTAGGHWGGNHSGMTIIKSGPLRTHKDGEGFREMKSGLSPTIPALKQIIGGSQGNRVYDPSGVSVTIAAQAGGIGAKTGLYMVQRPRGNNKGGVKDIAPTLSASPHGAKQNWDSYDVGTSIRRLTPVECERLQGFPDNWTKYGEDEHGMRVDISDTQRYKMCGNAVTTNVIRDVFERILL
jgi:DNA (cytosine-5)-methyltransferase 1